MNSQTTQPTLEAATSNFDTQTTQHTLKAAISNALKLRSLTTQRKNDFNHNLELESYKCSTGDCGIYRCA